MSYPSYVDQIRESGQSSPRTGDIVRRIWHHQASTNDDATITMMVTGTRQVSANDTVDIKPPAADPTRRWARITGVVPIERRAWTSSSATADGQAMTAEVCNSTGTPDWGISEATYAACALIAAHDYLDRGIPLKRATKADPTGHLGHREVLGMFGQGYATGCPYHLDIDRIILDGAALVELMTKPTTKPKDPDMPLAVLANGHIFTLSPGRIVHQADGAQAEFVRNVLTADDKWVETDLAGLVALLDALDIPREVVDGHEGRVLDPIAGVHKRGGQWSYERELLQAARKAGGL